MISGHFSSFSSFMPILVLVEKVVPLFCALLPNSHQKLSCLRSGVDYPRFIDDDTAEELLRPLLRQLDFWCECGISGLIMSLPA